jgi:ABC-type multidrug transport system fused ATPase/permease subunit
MLDRKALIDPSPNAGHGLSTAKGKIDLKNVSFSYGSRKGVGVLKNATMRILPGQKVGLVGTSGSGKSTLVEILLRFYDPDNGVVVNQGSSRL